MKKMKSIFICLLLSMCSAHAEKTSLDKEIEEHEKMIQELDRCLREEPTNSDCINQFVIETENFKSNETFKAAFCAQGPSHSHCANVIPKEILDENRKFLMCLEDYNRKECLDVIPPALTEMGKYKKPLSRAQVTIMYKEYDDYVFDCWRDLVYSSLFQMFFVNHQRHLVVNIALYLVE